jgi:hypothetical protein
MIELVFLWSIAIALIASLAVQISDYKKRKQVNADIKYLIRLFKGEQK